MEVVFQDLSTDGLPLESDILVHATLDDGHEEVTRFKGDTALSRAQFFATQRYGDVVAGQ